MRAPQVKLPIEEGSKEQEYFTRTDFIKKMNEVGIKGDRWSTLRRYELLGLVKYPNRYIQTLRGRIYLLKQEDIDRNLKQIGKYKESKRMRKTLLKKARKAGIRIYPHWK